MAKYLALLRGINVGGHTKVEMSRLKTGFEKLGSKDVSTYINSGNVIFNDSRSSSELTPIIEKMLAKTFNLNLRVVLRDQKNLDQLCRQIPASWTNDTKQKTDVLFLWDEINNADILKKIVINPQLENVRYISGALVWNIGRENVIKGAGVRLIKSDLYKYMTARNINTVRKLRQLIA